VFDISFETLFVLGVLAFILFGPQKLPEYAGKLGRLLAKLRQATAEMTQQVNNPFQYPQEPAEHENKPLPGAVKVSRCPYCREVTGMGNFFCPKCGKRINEQQLELPLS
jgi:Sec-independent protein translocase protein TatA